jgi:hypothetical protein
MKSYPSTPFRNALIRAEIAIGLLSAALVIASLLWQGRMGFLLSDEGLLWYDAQRTMKGEVPIRDFMSYDIGRYYWCAAFMSAWGDNGIIALRYAAAIFQAVGLYAGLLVVTRTTGKPRSLPWLLLATAVIAVWMYPRHKIFDTSISLVLIALLAFLAERPTIIRYFVMGIGVGLSAVFGRNHGIYGVFGSLVVMTFLFARGERAPSITRSVAAWVGGIAVGYLPMLAMLAFVRGFASAFWESIHFIFEARTTNLTLPIPWPWRVEFGRLPLESSIRSVLFGFFFIGLLVFGVAAVVRTFCQLRRREPVSAAFLACTGLALPYAHYAFSRADREHLALGVFPLLLGCLVWLSDIPNKRVRWSFGAAFCAACLFVIAPSHPGWQRRTEALWSPAVIGHDTLLIDPATGRDVAFLKMLANRFAAEPTQSFLAIPFWPGAYAMMDRKCPIWEVFPIWPRSVAFQQKEIKSFEAAEPSFVAELEVALDNREELRFRNSHRLLNDYIEAHFQTAEEIVVPTSYRVLLPRLLKPGRPP